jgi:acetate kinase
MTPGVLVVNAGSSSIKFAVFAARAHGPVAVGRGAIDGLPGRPHFVAADEAGHRVADEPLVAGDDARERALATLVAWIRARMRAVQVVAAGHRIVHGGERFAAPVLVDGDVLQTLARLVPLAPLHQPHNLAPIEALARIDPALPQVACFDTAFHRTQPPVAQAYALPRELTAAGVRRYGFHGLSYEYVAGALPAHLGGRLPGRVVVAHLGNGASMCALRDGRSVATTMGFTALEGLPMGTRSGSIDPAIVLWLLRERGLDVDEVADLLHHRAGLLGVSGVSGDVRDLLASPSPHAAEALDLFVYRIGRELGSLAAALGGLDALVFTAGIGERAAPIRARVCEGAAWLGIRLDPEANARHLPRISAGDSLPVLVIPTDEEVVIARHTLALVATAGQPSHPPAHSN